MKALIIDDEPKSHTILEYLLTTNHPEVEVVGHAYGIKEGVALIAEKQPNLVFLDIEFPNGSGFDLLDQFQEYAFNVIFITGHKNTDYAINALRLGGLDFLLKPIDQEDLQKALNRFFDRNGHLDLASQLTIAKGAHQELNENNRPSRILIATTDKISIREVEDIVCLIADRNYTDFHFANGLTKLTTSMNIGEYETYLQNYDHFMRVHRSCLANLKWAKELVRTTSKLIMDNGQEVPVAANKRQEVIDRLKRL